MNLLSFFLSLPWFVHTTHVYNSFLSSLQTCSYNLLILNMYKLYSLVTNPEAM